VKYAVVLLRDFSFLSYLCVHVCVFMLAGGSLSLQVINWIWLYVICSSW